MKGSKGDTDVKSRLLDSVGEGTGGMIWENSIETCTLLYVKEMTSASSMHEALKTSALEKLRGVGWGGRWEGGSEMGGGHMYTCGWFLYVWQKPSQYYKVIIL